MKMSTTVPVLAVRGSTGISMNYGPPGYDPVTSFTRDDSKACKAMLFSQDGKFFAWFNGAVIKVVNTSTFKVQCEIPRKKVCNIAFSPLGTYLLTWEPSSTSADSQPVPNLHFWKSDSGELVRAFIHKNQTGWEPQWSADEKLCARLLNNDVLFYEDCSFDVSVNKCSPAKVAAFSLSPGPAPHHVLCYLPGQPGQPSFGRLFQYPRFDATQSLANKSFFTADRVEMFWNKQGTGVLLMTITEVDKTGASYYGKQTLHFVSTRGETANVFFSKEGPVHSVQWNPKGTEFCVVFGFMPAKASLFNFKCEVIFEFDPAPRNTIYYNPFGNILILGGFGNLRGNIEIWDANNRKLITSVKAPETTLLHWSPDGEHFMTAVTAPRLRQGNGFKIWHYSGSLLYERPWNQQEELWEVSWQSFPLSTFKEPAISTKQVEGIQPSQTQASKTPYRPPSARGKETNGKSEDGTPSSIPDSMSKNALKLRKWRESRKAKKEAGENQFNHTVSERPIQNQPVTAANGINDAELPDDPEKLKKIKKIKGKLKEIARLKELKDGGKQLELNQLEKIKKEDELTKELSDLIL